MRKKSDKFWQNFPYKTSDFDMFNNKNIMKISIGPAHKTHIGALQPNLEVKFIAMQIISMIRHYQNNTPKNSLRGPLTLFR